MASTGFRLGVLWSSRRVGRCPLPYSRLSMIEKDGRFEARPTLNQNTNQAAIVKNELYYCSRCAYNDNRNNKKKGRKMNSNFTAYRSEKKREFLYGLG